MGKGDDTSKYKLLIYALPSFGAINFEMSILSEKMRAY